MTHNVTHIRGPARAGHLLALRDQLTEKLKAFSHHEEEWTPEQVEELRDAMAALHDTLDDAFVKVVNGFKRGDTVELRDQTIAKISEFTEHDSVILFTRSNGLKGRAEIEYVKGHKR